MQTNKFMEKLLDGVEVEWMPLCQIDIAELFDISRQAVTAHITHLIKQRRYTITPSNI